MTAMPTSRGLVKRSKRLPPTIKGRPIVGALLDFRRDPLGYFLDAARTYGDIYSLYIGPSFSTVVVHPEQIKYVLQDNNRNYVRAPLREPVVDSYRWHQSLYCRWRLLAATATAHATCLSPSPHAGFR